MSKIFEVTDQYDEKIRVKLGIDTYLKYKGIYIGMYTPEDIYIGDVTANLGITLPPYYAYLDVDDIPDIEDFVKEHNLGTFTGDRLRNGYVEYPLYKFNREALKAAAPKGIEEYEKNLDCLYKKKCDGWFTYYENKKTGEKKLKLDKFDIETESKFDDFCFAAN